MEKLLYLVKALRIRWRKRHTPFLTTCLGFKCKALDTPSFLFMADEIFFREVYKFETTKKRPYILDCGANIGLSTIYFKRLYPEAEIIAFEPYQLAIDAFKFNTSGLGNVKLIEKGLSSYVGETDFFQEGSDGSRIALEGDGNITRISTETLSPYLDRDVDFLKIDIEGSELEVMRECYNKLSNVKRIFIEYHALETRTHEFNELLSIITNAGFKYYIEAGGIRSKSPFVKIESRLGYSMLVSIFCFR